MAPFAFKYSSRFLRVTVMVPPCSSPLSLNFKSAIVTPVVGSTNSISLFPYNDTGAGIFILKLSPFDRFPLYLDKSKVILKRYPWFVLNWYTPSLSGSNVLSNWSNKATPVTTFSSSFTSEATDCSFAKKINEKSDITVTNNMSHFCFCFIFTSPSINKHNNIE